MWLRDPLVIEVADNTVTPIGFQFYDENADAPLNLTGYSFECHVANVDGGLDILPFSCDLVDAVAGELDIAFDGTAFGDGNGTRFFGGQIVATDEVGESVTAARLVIAVNQGIS